MSEPVHHIAARPTPKGYWQIGGPHALHIYPPKRPRWLTRQLCRLLLEWEWIDNKEGSKA